MLIKDVQWDVWQNIFHASYMKLPDVSYMSANLWS